MDDDKKDIKKPLSDADAGGSSLAYMPRGDGTADDDKPEISMDKFDRDEEKKTMADIATELSNDDDKKAVKIGVNGKEKSKPKSSPKSEGLVPEELPALDAEPELTEAELDSMHGAVDRPSAATGGKAKGLLVAGLIVSLIASGVFGWLWWTARSEQADLAEKVAKLEGTAPASSPAATATTTDLRLISELKLNYKLDDASTKLTYRFREVVDAEKKVHRVLTFSSVDVITAERLVSNASPKCTAEFAPLGSVTEYTTGETYKAAKIETQTVDQQTIFQVGDMYYVYEASQAACSADKTVQAAVSSSRPSVTDLLKTLTEAK